MAIRGGLAQTKKIIIICWAMGVSEPTPAGNGVPRPQKKKKNLLALMDGQITPKGHGMASGLRPS
jgi:hypothetical protein